MPPPRPVTLALLLPLAGCVGSGAKGGPPDAGSRDAGAAVTRATLVYGADPSEVLDLYTPSPAPSAPLPAVVLAHGGLWQSGSRDDLGALCAGIVQRSGYAAACATIDYRPSQDLGGACAPAGADAYRAQIRELATAYGWLQKNAAARRLDPQRMFVGGHSAGGHLAHVLNLRWAELSKGVCPGCSPPAGAVGFEGIYDVRAWEMYDTAHWGGQFSCATQMAFGGTSCTDATLARPCWDAGSPRFLAEHAAELKLAPQGAALVIHSPGDDWVDLGEATAFGAAFGAAFPAKKVIVETGGVCATGEHADVLGEASLSGCVARFIMSGGTGI